jgi:hypothetical protein
MSPRSYRSILALVLTAALVHPVAGAPKPEDEIPPRLDLSISKGLAFLAKQQEPDGALERDGTRVAITSLGLIAFLAAGNAPDLGKYGFAVQEALEWVLSQQAQDGYFGAGDHGMYAHAITTLALAECYGVESNPQRRIRIHTALEKAVRVITDAQDTPKSNPIFAGGWRYERNSQDSDLSVSAWNVLALRAADDVGIAMPNKTRQRALTFVQHCHDDNTKGFSYQPGSGAQSGDTAIGIVCLYLLDATDGKSVRVDNAIKYLESHPVDENSPYLYYASSYVTQAAFKRGGDAWTKVGRAAIERLIRTQEKDGGWSPGKSNQEPGRVYATAMALQALAVPYRLLPIYQR